MVAIIHKRSWRDFDWLLALLAIGIVLFGTLQIRNAQPTETYWVKQLIGLAIGLVAMLAIAFTDYRRLLNLAPAFYIFGLILLVLVLLPGIGLKINGQRAWIKVPGIGQFQPSEFVKVTTAMMLARYFGKNRVEVLSLKEMIVGGLILATSDRIDPPRTGCRFSADLSSDSGGRAFLICDQVETGTYQCCAGGGSDSCCLCSRRQNRRGERVSAGTNQRDLRSGEG